MGEEKTRYPKEEQPIDIFLTWVDSNDLEWQEEKRKYEKNLPEVQKNAADKTRFESWDNLQYLFRGIEKCMPWVNKVFLVTWGHVPSFLNVNHPKLEIIKHTDFIPEKYLPTFNSNVIEMNLHRIKNLSENFILFNDDCFPITNIEKEYYFKNNLMCDEAIERTLSPTCKTNIMKIMFHIHINNMIILNKYFKKREVQKKNFFKWYNIKYGKKLFRNLFLSYFYDFDYFSNPHEPAALKKSIFEKLWILEPDMLEISSKNKFRSYTDVSWYLARYWRLCEGDFYPERRKGKYYVVNEQNYKKIADEIRQRKYPIISINEESGRKDWDKNWENIKKEINAALEEVFPDKSSFEL